MADSLRFRRKAGAVLAVILLGALSAGAVLRLSTSYMGIHLKDLRIGRTYDLEKLIGKQLDVKNDGDKPVTVQIEVEKAFPAMLLPGYAPIPDQNWIRVEPAELSIAPGGTALARVFLTIPNDPTHRGKKYQGALWIRTRAQGQMSVGLRVKLPFTISRSK